MKVLHINCSDKGSTGKIIREIYIVGKEKGFESILCNPKCQRESFDNEMKMYKTSFYKEQSIYKRFCNLYGYQYGFAPISTYKILNIIKNEKPDIIHVHSINCYMVNIYSLFSYFKKYDFPIVITNHAEFFYTGNCSHAKDCNRYLNGCGSCPDLFNATRSVLFDTSHKAWKKMKNCIQGIRRLEVASVSPWVMSRSQQSPIMNGVKQSVVLNGVNTEIFCIHNNCQIDSKCKVILFVTASFSSDDYSEKGGGYIVELAKRFSNDNVKFLIIGKINEIKGIPDNISLIGRIDDQNKLASYYCKANLTVVVSRRETFSMPVAESLCCGTPVVGFKAGGPESISNDKFSEFVTYGDLDYLENIIRNKWIFFKTVSNQKEISESSIKMYDSRRMANEYLEIYKELLDEKNRDTNIS